MNQSTLAVARACPSCCTLLEVTDVGKPANQWGRVLRANQRAFEGTALAAGDFHWTLLRPR